MKEKIEKVKQWASNNMPAFVAVVVASTLAIAYIISLYLKKNVRKTR